MNFMRTRILPIVGIHLLLVTNIDGSTAHEWHDHNPSDQFQGHLYNNDTLKSRKRMQNLEDIRRLKSSFALASAFKYQIGYEDVAIFIGTTKSGKSTLINCLLGNELIGTRESIYNSISIKKVDDSPGPEIGKDLASETSIPTRWKSSKMLTGLTLWDCPGFQDNRGPTQDITNAFYVKELFMNVKSAKIVLVSDINDILSDRINSFLSLLNSVEYLFNEKFKDCFSSIVIAFTKVPNDFEEEPLTVDYISQLLEHKILSSSSIKISDLGKEFLQHLSLNTNQIAFIKKAKIGPVSKSITDDIIKIIESIDGINHENLEKVSPSIAPESKVFLHEVRHDLSPSISVQRLNEIMHDAFNDFFAKKLDMINSAETREDLNSIKNDLSHIKNKMQQIIESKSSFYENIDMLQAIDLNLRIKIDNEQLVIKSKTMEFIDNILNLRESHVCNDNLHSAIESVKSRINDVISEIQLKLQNIERREIERRLEIERIERERELERVRREYEIQIREKRKSRGFFGTIGRIIDEIFN